MPPILTAAVRGFRRDRSTLVLAFGVVSLALSASIVTFSIVDAVALRPLPYSSPSRLIAIASPTTTPGALGGLSPADYFQLERGSQSFSGVAASRPAPPMFLDDGFGSDPFSARFVTTNLFELLGVRAAVGRSFSADDEKISGVMPVMLSHETWATRFGLAPDVVGRTINAQQQLVQVIGVLPKGVWYPMELVPPAIYLPYRATAADRANTRIRPMSVVARLRPQITITQARADVVRLSTSAVVVMPLLERVVGPAKRWLFLLLAAVVLVLLIACVNVATLLLARAATRSREFAVRASLGESPRSLTASLLLEGIAIATASGVVALLISAWGVEAARTLVPPGLLTRDSLITLNGRVVFIAFGMVVSAAAIFGTAPALLMRGADAISDIKAEGSPIVAGSQIERTLNRFLTAEVSVISVLLVATALVVRSFISITAADLGFDRRNVASIEFRRDAVGTDLERRSTAAALRSQLLETAQSIPGVTGAAISVNAPLPLGGASVRYSVVIPGYGETLNDDLLETRFVTPEYFDVMGIRLIAGRWFTSSDRAGMPSVVLINDVAAQRFFNGRNPVGETITFRGPTTVIGVFRSVRYDGPEGNLRPEMYLPADQDTSRLPFLMGTVLFRTDRTSRQIAEDVREAIRPILGVEPGQPQFVDDSFRRLTAGRRFNATVMGLFGTIAVVLGVAGIYATTQFLISRRFREIGVRLALGATPARIIRMVLSAALWRITVGLSLGVASTLALSGLLRSLVFGVTATEPRIYFNVALFIVGFGLMAAMIPALRAASVDPAVTLRRD